MRVQGRLARPGCLCERLGLAGPCSAFCGMWWWSCPSPQLLSLSAIPSRPTLPQGVRGIRHARLAERDERRPARCALARLCAHPNPSGVRLRASPLWPAAALTLMPLARPVAGQQAWLLAALLAALHRSTAPHCPAPPVFLPHLQFKEAWYDAPTVGRKQEDVACSVRDTGLFGLARCGCGWGAGHVSGRLLLGHTQSRSPRGEAGGRAMPPADLSPAMQGAGGACHLLGARPQQRLCLHSLWHPVRRRSKHHGHWLAAARRATLLEATSLGTPGPVASDACARCSHRVVTLLCCPLQAGVRPQERAWRLRPAGRLVAGGACHRAAA